MDVGTVRVCRVTGRFRVLNDREGKLAKEKIIKSPGVCLGFWCWHGAPKKGTAGMSIS